jgi:hypothetical protein
VCGQPAARYTLDNLNKEYNALNKAVAKLKIVRPPGGPWSGEAHPLTHSALLTQAGEDASQQMEQCATLDKQRLTAEVRGDCHRRAASLLWLTATSPGGREGG